MTLFDHNKFNRTLRLSMLLLVAAGGGLFYAIRSYVLVSTARPALEGIHTTALAALILLSLTIMVAFCAVVLAALALYRRETIRRKKSEMRLHRCRQTADLSSDLIVILAPSGRIEYVNDAVEQVTGFGKSELIGKQPSPHLPWYGDAGAFRDIRSGVLKGTDVVRKIRAKTKDGAMLTLLERIAPLRNETGVVTWLISTARDLTREQGLEDRIDYLDRYDPLTTLPKQLSLRIRASVSPSPRSSSFLRKTSLPPSKRTNISCTTSPIATSVPGRSREPKRSSGGIIPTSGSCLRQSSFPLSKTPGWSSRWDGGSSRPLADR